MQGGSKDRAYGKHTHELEDYFSELNEAEPETIGDQPALQTDHWSTRQELRRLSAYVSHLRTEISERAVQPAATTDRSRTATISVAGILAFAAMAGIAIGALSSRR